MPIRKQQTLNRRATIFAGGFNEETGEDVSKPTKERKDLKKINLL